MRPFNKDEYLSFFNLRKKTKEEPVNDLYISRFPVGSDEWKQDVEKHSQEINGVKIIGRINNELDN